MIIQILGVLLVLGLIVVIHEFGHFLSARSIGIAVQEFAVGIGPAIYKRQGQNTLFSLRCIPFGGYCLFDTELEGADQRGRSLSLAGRRAIEKVYVSIAGPVMNFLLAAILFAVLFSFLGITVGYAPVIGTVQPDSAAMEAGILPGDRILAIEGETLATWQDLSAILATNGSDGPLRFTIQRDEDVIELLVTPRFNQEENRIMIGVVVDDTQGIVERFPPLQGIQLGIGQTIGTMGSLIDAIASMVIGKVSIKENLSGPVALTMVIAETVSSGLSDTLFLTAFLSVNLGIMNLLPIPALDGGRILLCLVEMLRRKPLKVEVEGWINAAGFVLLITLMVYLTFKDIFGALY